MKITLNILKTLAASLAALAAADITGVINILPADIAKWAVLVPTASAAILHGVKTLGDLLDDGKHNGSFYTMFFFLTLGLLAMPSCSPLIEAYRIDNSGLSSKSIDLDPYQEVPAEYVTPILSVPMPEKLGGGRMQVPIGVYSSK